MLTANQLQTIDFAIHKLSEHPVYIDTETTGLDRNDEIIELSIIDDIGTTLYSSLVRPSKAIPFSATRIHNITNEMVSTAQSWPIVWAKIEPLLVGKLVGIYNAAFDLRLLLQSHSRYGMRWSSAQPFPSFCIMKLYAQFIGEWNHARGGYRWFSLDEAGRKAGISLPNTHRAADDAKLARALLHYIASYPKDA